MSPRTVHHPRRAAMALMLATCVAAAAGCASPGHGPQPGGPERATSLVLADADEFGRYNPVGPHAMMGVSPFYDGLLRPHSRGDTTVPTLEPALAAAMPKADSDGLTYRVRLRTGVKFHDGSDFDAEDVVATYRTILDPSAASPVAPLYSMLRDVTARGRDTVVFRLRQPYADFSALLLTGIGPSEKVTGPWSKSELNAKPDGTGPYRLASLTPDQMVLQANADYWGGKPKVERLVRVRTTDDNARAQRLAAGEVDGAWLPPALADGLADRGGLQVDSVRSGDWRSVVLPGKNPFTQSPEVRKALNMAVDRKGMVSSVLAGSGRVASFPLDEAYGSLYDPRLVFHHDPAGAERLLDQAGWAKGADGIRRKHGRTAGFTLLYFSDDAVSGELAAAFAADLEKIGVQVTPEGANRDQAAPQLDRSALVLTGGARPYSPDAMMYDDLHTRSDHGGSPFANPGGFGNRAMDEALELGRRTVDPEKRAQAYRAVQREYLKDPVSVYLVFVDHTYVSKTTGWERGPAIFEPHGHDISFGPWWNLRSWT